MQLQTKSSKGFLLAVLALFALAGTFNTASAANGSSISGMAWVDANNDNIRNAGDAEKPGVTVEIFDIAGGANTLIASTTTDNNGEYAFTALPDAGYYKIAFTTPASYSIVTQLQGTSHTNSDIDANGFAVFHFLIQGNLSHVDAGYREVIANTAPEITSALTPTMGENTLTAQVLTASDAQNDTLTFSLYDYTVFTLVNGNELTFRNAPDFENPQGDNGTNAYSVGVSVTDGHGGLDTENIVVTVTDENDIAPSITPPTGVISVNENQTAAFAVSATDAEGNTLEYTLPTNTADNAVFSIDSTSGVVTFATAPDFEAPQDANTDNAYIATVEVSDGVHTETQDYTVQVNDITSTDTPQFSTPTSDNIIEGVPGQWQITLVPDTEMNTEFFIDSTSADAGVNHNLFNLDATTGELSLINPLSYVAGGDNTYYVTIGARNTANNTDASMLLTLTVIEAQQVPAFTIASNNFLIQENTTAITTLTATDPNGDALTFSMDNTLQSSFFTLDTTTGVLTFATAPDFENPQGANNTNTYQVLVRVTDDSQGALSASQTLNIEVTDISEGSAGGGGGSSHRHGHSRWSAPLVPQEETPTPTTTAPTQQTDALPPVGQVLGDSTFFFATNMFYGMRNNDVTELQDRLSEEGFYGGPITGFFGNLTRGAVIRYQKVHNITPAVGYVGPLTRNALNTATNAAPSTSQQQASAAGAFSAQQASAVQARINQLMELVRNLILQLK